VLGRFPLFMDACVSGHLIEALQKLGWDCVRAIDLFPEGTPDPIVFAYAAQEQRVFVTNDAPIAALAYAWLAEGRPFRMIFWPQEIYRSSTIGSLARAFEALATQDDPFVNYPIVHLVPRD
jgi:predicted nuclease of predicted toxin-antitoxin system